MTNSIAGGLEELGRSLLLCRDPERIRNEVTSALCAAFKAPRAALFLWESDHARLEPGDPALLPDPEVAEFVFQEGDAVTLPNAAGTLLAVFPLRVGKQPIALLSVDVAGVAEEAAGADHAPVKTFLERAAVGLSNALAVARSHDESVLLRNILESITNGILMVDPEHRIRRLNRNSMAMLELTPDCLGRPVREVLPAPIVEALETLLGETSRKGFALERVVVHRLAQGAEVPLAVSTSPLLDEDRRDIGTIIVLRDMTASRELDRLRKLDQAKSEFVANVSHELKTPLTSIKAYTEALQDMAREETMVQFLSVIQEESDRLLHLINDLLNVSRIQAGKMGMHFALCDPRSIVTEILDISRGQSARHRILPRLADDLPQTVLDKEKMKEVAVNLLSNAVKYSPDGGDVWIRMRREENNLRLEVEDRGIGIAPQHLPRLFEAFYRVDSSLTAATPGTGLGLVIVRSIVEGHGGKIWVESEVGRGTTFHILLPLRTAAPDEPLGLGD